MRMLFAFRSFSVRLVLGIVVLILATTLSAGVPAYWLTRSELERQAWSHVAGARQATLSLYQAEWDRLANLARLFSERPTLQRLLREGAGAEIPPYIQAFQRQSGLGLLYVCHEDGQAGAEEYARCPAPSPGGFAWFGSRPAILVTRPVVDEVSGAELATAVAGLWLDDAFLARMAGDTGVEQSVLLPAGGRATSSIPGVAASPAADRPSPSQAGGDGNQVHLIGEQLYYTAAFSIPGPAGGSSIVGEVALPIDALVAIERRALFILAASTGLVALLGTAFGAWYIRRLLTPLQQLTQTAEQISGGDLAASIPEFLTPREVATLAAALQRSQTSVRRALDELSQARNWLDNLVQSIVEGVVTFDETGHVTFINEKAADLASLPVEEAVGLRVDQLFSVSDDSGNRTSLERLPLGERHRVTLIHNGSGSGQALRRPGQRAARRLGRSSAGPDALLEVTTTRIRAPEAGKTQTALVLRDITQEESLRRLRSYFLANITHEFRTPLSTLSASMELLMNEGEDLRAAEMRELLKPIHLSLLSLQTLIDNLLESSSIEAGRFAIRRQPVDLNRVITQAVRVVQPLLERREQTLSLTEPAFQPPLVGDGARLTQVLVNLLSNASKYSPTHSTINLEVEQIGARLRLAVADRGAGIPVEERANLFRRFVRLSGDHGEQYGIGLGLHVVKITVEAHGGQIGVDEHPGGGSIFWFDLPIEQGENGA